MSLRFLRGRPFSSNPTKRLRKDLRKLEAQLVDHDAMIENAVRFVVATEAALAAREAAGAVEGLAEARAELRRTKDFLAEQSKIRDQFIAVRDAFRAALGS